MFGAFKCSARLSGGLLWKIPWRLSRPQKLRHRQRLRRVDKVVSVLDSALQRQFAAAVHDISATSPLPPESSASLATSATSSLSSSQQDDNEQKQRMMSPQRNPSSKSKDDRRHGKGPKKGDYVPTTNSVGISVPGKTLLRDIVNQNGTTKLIERWKAEMPTEQEMLPRDKYTMFDKKVRGYRKGVHKLPKWTRMSQRLNPPGF